MSSINHRLTRLEQQRHPAGDGFTDEQLHALERANAALEAEGGFDDAPPADTDLIRQIRHEVKAEGFVGMRAALEVARRTLDAEEAAQSRENAPCPEAHR